MPSIFDLDSDKSNQQAFTVSELNRDVKSLLEANFPSILVEGEISNLATPSSGHWYFTLKDRSAQVRCAMFRSRNMAVRFRPEEGSLIQVRARLSLYEGRGDYQLLVDRMTEVGDGALQQAFEALKQKLLKEGLFDESQKQALPPSIKHIGIITSPTGAAIHDVISVIERRFPAMRLTVIPVAVQGDKAVPELLRAIEVSNQKQGCLHDLDVLILGRGGGSLEDLWAFNDERLARAIHASKLPIVSAVGHEVDFSISDFVADVRAATPSAAAELLSPSQDEYTAQLNSYTKQFNALIRRNITQQKHRLESLTQRQRHPGQKLEDQAQRLDELEARLRYSFTNHCQHSRSRLEKLSTALRLNSPLNTITSHQASSAHFIQRLKLAARMGLEKKQQRLQQYSQSLHTVSPLATLGRGYSISKNSTGDILRSSENLKVGDTITTLLSKGEVVSRIEDIEK